MEDKEKFELGIDYLNKIIKDKKSTKCYQEMNDVGYFGFENFDKDGFRYDSLRVSKTGAVISFQDGSNVGFNINEKQRNEIRYLFDKIVEISGENGVENLKNLIDK